MNVAGCINAAVVINGGEGGSRSTSVSSRQRIVQRRGKTVVEESET